MFFYIHKVRTPLNTVAIGADVLLIELEVLGDQIPELLIDIVAGKIYMQEVTFTA